MKAYPVSDIKRINKELEKEFIEKGEFLKVINDMRHDFLRELESMKQNFLKLIDELFARQKMLEERIEKLERRIAEEKRIIEFRELPKEEALRIIKEYIRKHPGCTTSQIIEDLRLDPPLVAEVLKELEEKGEVEGLEPK